MVVAAVEAASRANIVVDIVVGAASEATAVGKVAIVGEVGLGVIEGVIGVGEAREGREVENGVTVDVEEAGLGVTADVARANVGVATGNVVVAITNVVVATGNVGAVVRGPSKWGMLCWLGPSRHSPGDLRRMCCSFRTLASFVEYQNQLS